MTHATLYAGDALSVLKTLPDESVQMCLTSPPYFGLRDYGTATWEGGDAGCDHKVVSDNSKQAESSTLGGSKRNCGNALSGYGDVCGKCGARRIDAQLGLETTPEAYVAAMVEVFREVKRVLRRDGTLWLNIGDSYAGGGGYSPNAPSNQAGSISSGGAGRGGAKTKGIPCGNGLKPKDLVGIPWLLAFALRADGWWLRSEIIWAKPNPMPESVTDRPTKSHEYVFLLTKSATYYYDAEAVKEPSIEPPRAREKFNGESAVDTKKRGHNCNCGNSGSRNLRSVWTIATQPFRGAHFATMPQKLAETCIKAGTSERGACARCGAPRERVVERGELVQCGHVKGYHNHKRADEPDSTLSPSSALRTGLSATTTTLGWRPTCSCGETDTRPCVVLDPFSGAGTTGLVATKLGRAYIGIELNPAYNEMARERIENMLTTVEVR